MISSLIYSGKDNARSALSTVIITGNKETFGKQPIVCRLLKGMFRERPSFPRYTVTYDADIVLKHLSTISLENITLKKLSYKVATLLCFLTGQRDQSINEIDIEYMYKDDKQLIFYIPAILKTTRANHHLKPLTLHSYPEEPLCIIKHIETYLEATKCLRGSVTKLHNSTTQWCYNINCVEVGQRNLERSRYRHENVYLPFD